MRLLQYVFLFAAALVLGYPAPMKRMELSVPAYIDPYSLIDSEYKKIIIEASDTYKVCPILIDTIIKYESRNKRKAKSRRGALGLMQLMPKTGKALGITNFKDPYQNIMGGTRYLAQQLKRFKGNLSLSLAAYNAGPYAVQRYGGVPPYKETKDYIKRITKDISSRVGSLTFYNPVKS